MNKIVSCLMLLSMPVIMQSMQQVEMKETAAKNAEQTQKIYPVVCAKVRCLSSRQMAPDAQIIEYADCKLELDELVDEQENPLVADPSTLLVRVVVSKASCNDNDFDCFNEIYIGKGQIEDAIAKKVVHISRYLYLPLSLFEGKNNGDVVSFYRKKSEDQKVSIRLTCHSNLGETFQGDLAHHKRACALSQNPCLRFSKACENRYKDLTPQRKEDLKVLLWCFGVATAVTLFPLSWC